MRIHSIETGFFSTDGAAMFGVVSKEIWTKNYPLEGEDRCPLTMRVVYAEIGTHKVLFDTGVGDLQLPGMSEYRFRQGVDLMEELVRIGCTSNEITDVVLSHLHFDHCGGSVRKYSEDLMIPAFKNAKYWVSQRQMELAYKPSLWEADSYAPMVLDVLENAGLLQLIDSDLELFPGLSVQLYNGHTEGQLVSWIQENAGLTYVIPGDVIPTSVHLTPLCISAYDCSAVISVDEKIRLMEAVRNAGANLIMYHDVENEVVAV